MDRFDLDHLIAAVANAQAGAIGVGQLLDLGATRRQIRDRVGRGRLRRALDGVLVVDGYPPTFEQRLWVARLSLGEWAAVSHESAAALHGLEAYPPGPVAFLVPNGRHRVVKEATVHQTRDPWMVPVVEIAGLTVTTIERTYVDLAATTTAGRLRYSLAESFARKRTTPERVGVELAAVARRGKPGVRLLAGILDQYQPGEPVKQSQLERDLFALRDRFGGPRLVAQWEYPTRQQVNGCADAGLPEALLAVEADGRRWHTRIADLRRDHERDAAAARHGVQVLRVLHEHIRGAPRETWRTIVETYEIRLRQLGRAAS